MLGYVDGYHIDKYEHVYFSSLFSLFSLENENENELGKVDWVERREASYERSE
jgi:hypothetical protein